MKLLGIGYTCVVVLMSVVTFACYGWDKRQARLGGQRISEHRLHMLALAGGWPGALLGRQTFRHKTQKTTFTIRTWFIVFLHVILIAGALYFFSTQAGKS
jgi:uncharacterized membrane protein YsdA (DUF1294 family)